MDVRIGKRYGNAQVFELSKSDAVKSFTWERLSGCSYWFLYDLMANIDRPEYIDDIYVWNTLQPARIGDECQPICIELRIHNDLEREKGVVSARHAKVTNDIKSRYLPHATLDERKIWMVKDKVVRKSMKDAVHAIYVGEDPDQCRNMIGKIRYLHDEKKHLLMMENPPTLSFSFLKSLMERFSTSLHNICFERIRDKNTGLAQGTCLILVFSENSSNVLRPDERMHRAGQGRRRAAGYNPY